MSPYVCVVIALTQDWGVLQGRCTLHTGANGPEDVCTCGADSFAVEALESVGRVTCGLYSRSMVLWFGGVYYLVRLLSSSPEVSGPAIQRAKALAPRLLAFEAAMANGGHLDIGMQTFANGLLWPSSVVYREVLLLAAAGRLQEARDYLWRLHSSICHEKGDPAMYVRSDNHLHIQLRLHSTSF